MKNLIRQNEVMEIGFSDYRNLGCLFVVIGWGNLNINGIRLANKEFIEVVNLKTMDRYCKPFKI